MPKLLAVVFSHNLVTLHPEMMYFSGTGITTTVLLNELGIKLVASHL